MANLRVYPNSSVNGVITPNPGGGQSSAVPLSPGINVMTDAASNGDSVQLPNALSGTVVIGIVNQIQGHTIAVFAKNDTSDSINGQDNSVEFDFPNGFLGQGQVLMAVCLIDGAWAISCAESGDGGLAGVTFSLQTASPNDSVNAGYILAAGGTSDMDLVLAPVGAGAFALALADGTSVGGNKRGEWAVDLQVFQSGKSSPTEVASGQHSFACNASNTSNGYCSFACGLGTTSSNETSHSEGSFTTASGNCSHAEGFQTTAAGTTAHAEGEETNASADWSHAEGSGTTASQDFAHAEGYNTTASGQASHTEGHATTASGNFAHAEGFNTVADGQGSQASGQDSWTRGVSYYQAYSSGGFASRGDQQCGRLCLKGVTTDGSTPVVLTSDGADASTNNQFVLPTNSAMAVQATVLGASPAGDTTMIWCSALVKNIAGTVSVVGSPQPQTWYNDSGASSWAMDIVADTVNNAMSVVVEGADATTIHWTAEVHSQELVTI
jgi:hypothetical protein